MHFMLSCSFRGQETDPPPRTDAVSDQESQEHSLNFINMIKDKLPQLEHFTCKKCFEPRSSCQDCIDLGKRNMQKLHEYITRFDEYKNNPKGVQQAIANYIRSLLGFLP